MIVKRVILIVITAIAFLVAHACLAYARRKFGMWAPGLGATLAAFGMAWVEHTRQSREMAEDLRDALRESDISDKAAALDMGLCPTKLSSQMSGREHLSLWRLASLSPAFQLAFAKRRIQRHGSHLVIERGMLADLIAKVERLTKRGVA